MTKQGIMAIGASLAALAFSTAAAAQAPQYVPIRVTFTGTVSSGPEDRVVVRQADGSYAPYTGTTPAYSYQNGSPVSVSFTTTMPNASYFTSNPQYQNATGIYRYPVNMNNTSNPFGAVAPNGFDFSGPINMGTPTATPMVTGMTLVFDSNTGQYSLDFANGRWGLSTLDGPSYSYDVATNSLTSTNSACVNNCSFSDGGIAAGGTASTVNFRGTVVSGAAPQQTSAGFWDMLWSGSWSLPTYGSGASSGGATQVPEPSVIVLFGSAAAGLMFARRRKRKAA